jgi:hypothetical protein
MATVSEGSSEPDGTAQEQPRRPSQAESEKRTGSLRHLFGPAYVVSAVWLVVIIAVIIAFLVWKIPGPFPKYRLNFAPVLLKELFDHTLNDYKAELARLDTNLSAQALLIATAVLVIIRRSDSLNFFGNSIPLSWLHAFIPILLVFLFMAFGYISHRLIAGRMLGIEIGCALPGQLQSCGLSGSSPYQELFRDASWIDGWYTAFIDTDDVNGNVSGIDRTYSGFIRILLILVLGTFTAAAHASALAMVSIGCRRYFATRQVRLLVCYYLLPLLPLTFLVVNHFLFAYGGPHRNLYQLYVAIVSVPLMAFLLWLSARIDKTSYPENPSGKFGFTTRRLRQQAALA